MIEPLPPGKPKSRSHNFNGTILGDFPLSIPFSLKLLKNVHSFLCCRLVNSKSQAAEQLEVGNISFTGTLHYKSIEGKNGERFCQGFLLHSTEKVNFSCRTDNGLS
jgi:hypothetical protein